MSDCLNIAADVVVEDSVPLTEEAEQSDATAQPATSDAWSQAEIDVPFDVDKFIFDIEALHYYTGLKTIPKRCLCCPCLVVLHMICLTMHIE